MAGPRLRFNPSMLPRREAFGIPQMQPQLGDEELLLRNFLETGNAAPVVQPQDQWDDEAWKIASLAGDPMGVREIFDKMTGEKDEQKFIKQLADIDWSSPDVATHVARMVGENPKGLTKNSASIMDMFADLGATSKKRSDFSDLAKYGTEPLRKAREVFDQTGDMELAHAAAADIVNGLKNSSKGTRSLTSKQQEELTDAEDAYEKALSLAPPEDKTEYKQYEKEKKALWETSHPGKPIDWSAAHELWVQGKQAKALADLQKKVEHFKQFKYVIPEHLQEIAGAPTATAPVVAPTVAPITPEQIAASLSSQMPQAIPGVQVPAEIASGASVASAPAVIVSKDQYDALPSGALYTANGQTRRKK